MDDLDKKTNSKVTRFKKIEKTKNLVQNEDFQYKVIKRDVNGINFNIDHLKEYSLDLKYTITLALQEKERTILHNYSVEGGDLAKFFKYYAEGKIEGDIIEIEKINPEILA